MDKLNKLKKSQLINLLNEKENSIKALKEINEEYETNMNVIINDYLKNYDFISYNNEIIIKRLERKIIEHKLNTHFENTYFMRYKQQTYLIDVLQWVVNSKTGQISKYNYFIDQIDLSNKERADLEEKWENYRNSKDYVETY